MASVLDLRLPGTCGIVAALGDAAASNCCPEALADFGMAAGEGNSDADGDGEGDGK